MSIKRFKKIYIEVTNVCNLDCNFCPKTNRAPRFMDEQDFLQVATQAKQLTDHIYFHIMGEPLLNPLIPRFLEIAHDLNLKVNMTTNGVLLETHQSMLLSAPALRQVNISLSSFEANDRNGNIAAYLDSIFNFVTGAQEAGSIICSLRLWNLDDDSIKGENSLNMGILEAIEQRFAIGMGARENLRDSLRDKHSAKLSKNLYLNLAEKFEWPDISRASSEVAVFCHGLRDHIGILVDGTVVPCCLDGEGNIPLGNIFVQPLQAIISTPRATAMYDGFSNRCAVEELCQKCGYARRY